MPEIVPELTKSAAASELPGAQTFERNVALAAQGMGVTFVGRVLQVAQRFAVGLLLAPLLGAEQYGLYNLALRPATLAGIVALLGLETGLVRFVSTYAGRRDRAGVWGVLQVGLGFPTLLSVVLGAGLFVLAGPIAERWFGEPRLSPLLQLAGLVVPFQTLIDTSTAALRGLKNQHYVVIARDICLPGIRIVGLIGLAIVGLNAERALAAFIFSVIVASLLLLYLLNRLFSLRRPFGEARRDTREILAFSLPAYLSDIVGKSTGSIQTMILGAFTSVSTVGVYALASNVNMLGKLIHSSMLFSAMPIIAEIHDRGDRRQLARFYQLTTRWTFTLNLPLFLTLLLFPETFLSLFGSEFLGGVDIITILVWVNLVNTATGTNGAMLDMTGYTRLKLVNVVVAAIVTLALNVLLIPRLGAIGAAVAALVSTVLVESLRLIEVFVLLRVQPYGPDFAKPVVAGALAALAVLTARHFLPAPLGYPHAALLVAVLLSVYASAILLQGLSPEDRQITSRLLRRLRAGVSG